MGESTMAELRISDDDILGLAQALDGLQLPDTQRALLSAIVALGAAAIDEASPSLVVDVDPVPSFSEQFAGAFTPGQIPAADAPPSGVRADRVTRLMRIGRH
ncbi:hypothetical protein AB0M02_21320 [Actinoplanes sp. NPDC051861]|uniref:hypothetical protein n=1 Tax=Actinoplanes sp. NPDC051861 TaxID=3155170 RepID=UPI0034357D83